IINIKEVKVVFPYQYNFAEVFNEQAIGIVKWLKLIHKKQKKPFTLDSPLPADLVIKIKFFSVEISDDIFEVKLKDNYALLEDEYNESLKRKKMLDEKLENLRKTNLLLPLEKIEELYNSLAKKNADIYVQRSRLLYHNADLRTPLITWTFEGVDFVVVADTSYHGTDRVIQVLKEIDEESPFPEEGLEFTTLWCRRVRGSMQAVSCQLRNYPQTLLEIKEFHVWGRLVGAEQEAAPRAKRTTVIQVGEPWRDMTVERSMPSLKFYHELNCDIESFCSAYGPCWDPIMAQVNLSMENISKPSADPSLSLPWWDKVRLLLHGRLTMSIQHLTLLMHASLDPYNMMEQMEMTWSDVIIDWTNAKIMMQGDLDIYVHTASKYDDCRLLHIPNLKFSLKLDWMCLANPNDHHVVMPCAPDKIPEYSSNQVHDSYRAFRSQQLNMSLSIETKPVALETSSDIPTMLLYSSTLRWLENLKVILSGVPKLTRRGILFNNIKPRKVPLSRHYRNIRLSVNFHKFQVCYWMSFTKQRGFELLGGRLSLSSEHTLALTPLVDGLKHRTRADWRIAYMNCELRDSEIWLYHGSMDDQEIDANKSFRGPVDRNYFLSVTRVSYGREASIKDLLTEQDMEDTPTHRLVVHGLKGAWTKHNRDVVFFLFDSYIKATLLKRNLSTEALKCFKLESQATPVKSKNMIAGSSSISQAATPSPMTRLQSGHAASMLQKLIAEAEANSVVFTEEIEGGTKEQQLHGVAACQTDDVLHKNWLIELVNSQVMLRGCETSGYVIVSASKAQILQRIHRHTWKERTLVSKTTWVGSLECMQYYATVDAGDPSPSFDNVMWLTVDNIEAQKDSMVISDLADLVGSGHSVGGVVSSTVGGASDPTSAPLQLQRIVSRCGCQFFYASYGENVDPSTLEEVHPPPTNDDPWDQEVAVDSFTLTHHDLDICTNSLQYAMILDLVNNLLLYVEPRKKEASEKLQRMRFQLQLCSIDDQKVPILQLQNQVRSLVFNLRRLEKEAYLAQKALEENPSREDLAGDLEQLEKEIYSYKEQLNFASEELAMMISCFKEMHVSATKQRQLATAQESGEDVVRRSEMCFKHAQWRLTDADGLLGIADLVLSNFLYSKITKNDDSVEHLLELGYFKVTNLLPNQLYKDVLQPTELQPNIPVDRQQALRIFCRDRAPVGGISVKEHLEVNVIPITIGLTYAFFTTMLKFFFPERATEKTEEHGYEEQDGAGTLSRQKKRTTLSNRSTPTSIDRDDIDKMKERAAENHTFLYIKIPEVPIRVSYKGEKEKNIEDLHDCSLMLPTLEYHNRTWTWLDLLLEMKNDSKRVLLSQAIKQKLQIKSSKTSLDESSQPQEEDKARLLLGSKLTGGPEKGTKKGLFGKSNK
ncbi:protein KIAA0100-like, partial [Limulus polyphemus]|uniref:Protein KIAA0100-like n=1 Tax=Limulus polyphemus TaxID=6850 RepID=A0ABM1BDX5_LIMPO